MIVGETWVDVAGVITAVAGITIAGLVAFMPFARRPKLAIEEDPDRANSRVESSGQGGLPHVRLLVTNSKHRRSAKGTHVLVEGYTVVGSHQPALTTLGHPSLEWPSSAEGAATGAVTVFAGGARPITLGYFIRVRRDESRGGLLRPTGVDEQGRQVVGLPHWARAEDWGKPDVEGWYFKFALHPGLDINDDRDKLPPVDDGYVIRLLVGADDGRARTFKVHLDWDGDPMLQPQQVLDSGLKHLAVE